MSSVSFPRLKIDHWVRLGSELGASRWDSSIYARLLAAYRETPRFYHNEEHLAECLAVFDQMRDLARRPEAVECALWFHDAVYDPRASNNEEQSAILAAEVLNNAGVAPARIKEIEHLILATKNHQPGDRPDAQVVIDADLSILGQPELRFWRYEAGIASEYAWVPCDAYRQKRSEILTRFLARPAIYQTPYAAGHYEQSARKNLGSAIEKLQSTHP